EDGKLMLTKSAHFSEITWQNVQARFGRDKFISLFSTVDLVAFVNWTMIPYMSDVWAALLQEFCPSPAAARRTIFFDLADPAKRTSKDILRALDLISKFEGYFHVILGVNEKEAGEIADVLGINTSNSSPRGLCLLGEQLQARLRISTAVIHPVTYALAVSEGTACMVDGPYVAKPLITTGAGDHFNAGFCL